MCWKNVYYINVILYVLVLPATKSLDNEKYVYFLATALYMADDQGKYVLLDKPLPPSIEDIIKEHAVSLFNPSTRRKAKLKVIPRPPSIQPHFPNPNTFIFRVDVREIASRKHFMSGMWDDIKKFWNTKILRKGTNTKKKTIPPILKMKANNSDNITDIGNGNNKDVTDSNKKTMDITVKPCAPAIKGVQWVNVMEEPDKEETWLENLKPSNLRAEELKEDQQTTQNETELQEYQPTSQTDFVPSDIYYSIEQKCKNLSDVCQLKLPAILEQPMSAYKYLLQSKKNLWNI